MPKFKVKVKFVPAVQEYEIEVHGRDEEDAERIAANRTNFCKMLPFYALDVKDGCFEFEDTEALTAECSECEKEFPREMLLDEVCPTCLEIMKTTDPDTWQLIMRDNEQRATAAALANKAYRELQVRLAKQTDGAL